MSPIFLSFCTLWRVCPVLAGYTVPSPLGRPKRRKVPRKALRTRVVRVGQQLLLTERGQCFQSIRLLFHGPSMAWTGSARSAQAGGVYA